LPRNFAQITLLSSKMNLFYMDRNYFNDSNTHTTDPMVQWLRLPTANPEVQGSNPGLGMVFSVEKS
jgi:hypothetical protein